MKKMMIYSLALAEMLVCISRVHAAESFVYGGPVGGTDLGSAYLPEKSGFYAAFLYGAAYSNGLYGNNGSVNKSVGLGFQVQFGAVYLLYVYPFKLAGGTLATGVEQSYTFFRRLNAGGETEYSHGANDLYADILSWSKRIGPDSEIKSGLPYGLTVRVAYSMIFPTGQYNPNGLGSSGHNQYFLIPNASITYLTGPNFLGDGTEFSASVFYDIATTNHATKYYTGGVLDFDGAISERVGLWQIGVAGNYASQLNNDTINGIPVAGNGYRLRVATVGPVIEYEIPKWKAAVKLKVSLAVWGDNASRQQIGYLTFFKSF